MDKKEEEDKRFHHQGYVITLGLGIIFTVLFGSLYLKVHNTIERNVGGLCNTCLPDTRDVWLFSKIEGIGMGIDDLKLGLSAIFLEVVSLFWILLCIGTIFFWIKNYKKWCSKNKKTR